MADVVGGRVRVVQPVHWLAEVAAVLARVTPGQAEEDIGLLYALSLPVRDRPEILQRARRLSIDLDHHLFDTLYHAVALDTDSVLVTADAQYLNKAARLGHIVHLADWVAADTGCGASMVARAWCVGSRFSGCLGHAEQDDAAAISPPSPPAR